MYEKFQITREIKGKMRHKWENPIYIISCLITVSTYFFALLFLYGFAFPNSLIGKFLGDINKEILTISFAILFIPLVVLIFRLNENAKVLANGIRITKNQFPDLYEMNQKYAKLFKLKNMPNIVISSTTKPISATVPGMKTNTIILHNMLYEIKRKDSNYKPALEFALLREYAHITLGHRTFRRQLLTIMTQTIPIVSNFLTRAEEYTADRWASSILGYDSKDYFCIEATGKFLWENIDINEVALDSGKGGLFEVIYSFTLPLPPITWRIHAIYKMGVFKYKFNELNFDFNIYDLKNSHGHFLIPPNIIKQKNIN